MSDLFIVILASFVSLSFFCFLMYHRVSIRLQCIRTLATECMDMKAQSTEQEDKARATT